ncbi:MAG: EAL domain-containing protein, partial [Pseudomonadota bacterium]
PALAALQLAINVSTVQLHQPGFVDSVLAAIRQAGINPTRLKLEITESAVLNDLDKAVAKLARLREEGIHISLDDFGTGYSSLSYLKRLPVDQIKIDRSFVRDLESDPNDAILASAIVSLARNFSLHVIAEGVENEVQYRKLNAFGCQAYQGYLFGKPLPLAQFEAALAGRQTSMHSA